MNEALYNPLLRELDGGGRKGEWIKGRVLGGDFKRFFTADADFAISVLF